MLELIKVSKKCKYALRAIFELSLREGFGPVKIHHVALAQAIPARFLEVILAELKHGGFVESKRGSNGGYMLARPADDLTVGEVINFLQGEGSKVNQVSEYGHKLRGDYVFSKLWKEVSAAISDAYSTATFAEMVEEELARSQAYVSNYAI